ncbi:MAG: CoA pyrophosphatase [Candidatus Sericytochromatia bacterium]
MRLDIEYIKEKINKLDNSVYSEPVFENSKPFVPASVLIPIFEIDNKSHIIFTKRTDKVSHHKGQISFPGGKFDKTDKDLEFTALRETQEEIGVNPEDIKIVGKINNMVTNTNFIVSPFVGILPYPYNFLVNPDEISELIIVPVKHLMNKNFFRIEKKEFNGKLFDIYYYEYLNHTIWGVTGKILFDFLSLIEF